MIADQSDLDVHPPTPPRPRPRWGLLDVALGVPYIVICATAGLAVGLLVASVVGGDESDLAIGVIGLAGLQIGLGTWPALVSRWKGTGMGPDWRLRLRPVDLPVGIGTGVIALGAGGVVGAIVAAVLGLDESDRATNTGPIVEASGTVWLPLLVLIVVVVGPTAEEIFFRGLLLRSAEKRIGIASAVVVSSLLFALVHFQGDGWAATLVLLSVIGTAGAVFAVVTVRSDRLGSAIVGHMTFNGVAVLAALATSAA
ncbi:MAG: type II CAAX endopeptidase family protein [Actinomycetota bacterium]